MMSSSVHSSPWELSLAALLPLALTSTQKSIRSLGKNWIRLHRLVYVAAAAGAIHFYWLVKRDKQEPLLYLAILTVLLGWRVAVWIAAIRKNARLRGRCSRFPGTRLRPSWDVSVIVAG